MTVTETSDITPVDVVPPEYAGPSTMPATVIAALARITEEIGGIERISPAERQRRGMAERTDNEGVKFAYRSIDQIAQAAQPLFGKYGVVIVPVVVEQTITGITVNNKPWSDTHVTVDWTIHGPGGRDDTIYSRTTGWGRDNSDKGINKAMTTAYKNLLLRILCIGDPRDDTDTRTDAAEADAAPAPGPRFMSSENVDRARANYTEIGASADEIAAWVHEATAERTFLLEEVFASEAAALRDVKNRWVAARAAVAAQDVETETPQTLKLDTETKET